MKAVALTRYLPISNPESLRDVVLQKPEPGPQDLLVAVRAVAINPVDVKVRAPKDKLESEPRILGWDAAGVVEAAGSEVRGFAPGDRVYYAGDITRPGTNAEYQRVDARIVGHMPKSLDFAQAAALPLTAITAWEALFDRLGISTAGADAGKVLLVIGGAGGVGSIGIQLAKKLAGLRVIATASRPESAAWCRALGADEIVDHGRDLVAGVRALGHQWMDYVVCFNDTDRHFPAMAELIRPQGTVLTIVEHKAALPVELLKSKSAALAFEFMFTRSMYQTPDMAEQGRMLDKLAALVDAGMIRSTANQTLGPIDAATLRKAHALVEDGHVVGKLVLEGFR